MTTSAGHNNPDSNLVNGELYEAATVFETLESAFWWVSVGPLPVTVHPHGFTDLPDRPLSLHQLRVRLASPSVSAASRAAIWSYLVGRARTQGARQPDWTIAAAGVALPDLVRMVATLFHRPAGRACDIGDLEAAALGGFYAELRRTDSGDTHDPRIRRRLLMAAYRAARTLRDTTNTPTSTGTGTVVSTGAPHTAPGNGSTRPARAVERDRQRARLARAARRRGHARDEQVRP